MVPDRRDEEEIFHAAIARPREQRLGYLREACDGDTKLLAHIQAMLQSYDAQDNFLESQPLAQNVTLNDSDLKEAPGTVIGRYKLLEQIGEGGMAVVYMAEQEQPIRRKVALKIIKLGMDTQQVIARFEAERQALALMDHPNIAKVLDAGATETGRPYFVMELVTGVSITEYCDKNSLCTKERLALFIQVCNAVQHAHQKGIVHRDLKPTNILVIQREGRAVPKVIDFGIAKATKQRLTEKTLFTRYAHIIGTPAYMSPEQAELSDIDVDTRSDIYSLGVLLYELLTGTTPFGEEELRKAGYAEMTRIIREKEPLRPSTRLTQMKAQTSTQIRNPKSKIENDLDWIVMKSLEKARDRRYDNVSALAEDVQRHLNEEPVSARAPSATYRLRKFLRRHPLRAIAAFIITVLVIGLAGTLILLSNERYLRSTEVSLEQKNVLSQAEFFFTREEFGSALALVRPLLDESHVKKEASILNDRILRAVRRKVQHITDKIETDSEDIDSYFFRARCCDYLGEDKKAAFDMSQYIAAGSRGKTFALTLGKATRLGPSVNSSDPSDHEWMPRISLDGLSLAVFRGYDEMLEKWVITRLDNHSLWGNPILENRFSGPATIVPGMTTKDGLEFYGWSDRPGGYGHADIVMMKRETLESPWSGPTNIGPLVNTRYAEEVTSISPNGLEIYFCDMDFPRPGGNGGGDLWVARRISIEDPWQKPLNLGPEINSPASDSRPHISADGLKLLFDSRRAGGYGGADLYLTRRSGVEAPWEPAINLGPQINSPVDELNPAISPDGQMLLFVRYGDIWMTPIIYPADYSE